MAAVSVLSPTPLLVTYPSPDSLETFANVAVQNIGSWKTSSAPQVLRIGATSNLVMESYNDAQMYLRDNSGFAMFNSAYAANGQRTDTQILDLRSNVVPWTNATATVLRTTTDTAVWVHGDDIGKTVYISEMQVRSMNSHTQLATNQALGFLINNDTEFSSDVIIDGTTHCLDSVLIEGDETVNGKMVVNNNAMINGSLFTQDVNVWQELYPAPSDPADSLTRIGYGFRINPQHQLELVKYMRFDGESEIIKRVAVFGNSPMNKNEKTDGTQYMSFDAFNGLQILSQNNAPTIGGSNGAINSPGYTFPAVQDTYTWMWNQDAGNVYTTANVGVGVVNPQHDLDVGGTINTTSLLSQSIVTQTFETTSDERLKEIYGSIDPKECLDKISQLDVINFKYTNTAEASTVRSGLRAQQVRDVMEDAVIVRKFAELEDCHLIDTSVMIAYLVGAVKGLAARLDAVAAA